ncbi:hypothetical protein ASG99_14430 [Bacillus sp. Soil768D1]|nr:hypothetical protein ASG99_14430 [Bacillus sp. Soil768D1]
MFYKKLFLISLAVTIVAAFVLPQIGGGYGIPLNWIIYKGDGEVTNILQIFQYKIFKHTQIKLGLLVLNTLMLFAVLSIIFKLYTKMDKAR